jgi:hypothetical protein
MTNYLSVNNNEGNPSYLENRLPVRDDRRYLYRAFVRLNNFFFRSFTNKAKSVFSSFCEALSNAYHRLQGSLCGRAQSIPTERAQRRLEIPDCSLDHAIIHVIIDPIEENAADVALVDDEGLVVDEEQHIDPVKVAGLKKQIDGAVRKTIKILGQIAKVVKIPHSTFAPDVYDYASNVLSLKNRCLQFLYREQSPQKLFENFQEIRNELDELIHNCPEDLNFHLEQLLSQCDLSLEAMNKFIDALEC